MKTFTSRRAPRGSAAVELSILMVALVPLILYTLFLEDLLAYKLESQEPTVSAPWDYAVYNFANPIKDKNQKPDINFTVQRSNRRTYCDHSAAYNSYNNVTYDCSSKESLVHHNGAAEAHQCWVVPGAHQVTCTLDNAVGKAQVNLSIGGRGFYDDFNKGGLATCNAKLGVMNSFLPHQIFTWSARKDEGNSVSTKQNFAGTTGLADAHNIQTDTDNGDVTQADTLKQSDMYLMREEKFSILHDPWALNADEFSKDQKKPDGNMEVIDPKKIQSDHPLYVRAGSYYDSAYGKIATGKAYLFGMQMNKFIDPVLAVMSDSTGDNPRTMPLAWSPEKDRPFNGHYASGWVDSRVEPTYQARTKNYFSKGASDW